MASDVVGMARRDVNPYVGEVEEDGAWPAIPGHRVEGIIGVGGFATVYQAVDLQLDRKVAAKVFGTHLSDDRVRQQFEREVKAASALSDHPNIVTIYQCGFTEDSRPYLTMALMETSLAAAASLPVEQATSIGVKIASALDAAHGAEIVHGDVKPDNILLNRFGEPALADFGIATIGGVEKAEGPRSFSAMYAAPEVLGGRPPTRLSDIYSLGSALYGLVEGSPPFGRPEGTSLAAFLSARAETPHPKLELNEGLDEFSELIAAMTAREPSRRPQSASEVGDRLRSVEQGMGWAVTRSIIATSRPTPNGGTAPGGTFGGRRRLAIAAAMVAILAVSAAMIVSSNRRDTAYFAAVADSLGVPAGQPSTSGASGGTLGSMPPGPTSTPGRDLTETAGLGEPASPEEMAAFERSATQYFDETLNREMLDCIATESLPRMSPPGRQWLIETGSPFFADDRLDQIGALEAVDKCVDEDTGAYLSVRLWFGPIASWYVRIGLSVDCLAEGPRGAFDSAGEMLLNTVFHTREFTEMAEEKILECGEILDHGDWQSIQEWEVVESWVNSAENGAQTTVCALDVLAGDWRQALSDMLHSLEQSYVPGISVNWRDIMSELYSAESDAESVKMPLLESAIDECGFEPGSLW